MSGPNDSGPDAATGRLGGGDAAAKPVPSHVLFAGQRRLLIEHGGVIYTLQITKQNKLLLTK
jgi:hemin uptake protein HemP